MLTPPEEFSFLCVARKESNDRFNQDRSDHFKHLFPHPMLLRLCGDPPFYLVQVSLNEEGPYWGWWTPDKGIIHIYISKILLAVCFPYGIKVEEERDRGRVVRVSVTEVRRLTSEEERFKSNQQIPELLGS